MKSLSVFGASALLVGSLTAQTTDTPQAMAQAIQRGDRAAISALLDNGIKPTGVDDAGVPLLMLATLFGDAPLVDQLLKHGAGPNQTDKDGATALMWAIPDIQKVRRLLDRGADVNARSSNLGRTPLLIAAGYPGTADVLTLLLAKGADLRAKDAAGLTALDIAMQSDADVEVVRLLVEKGLDPNEALPAAVRAVYARPRPALVQYMTSRNLKVPPETLLATANWQTPDLIERWIELGADVNARTGAYRSTPLMRAASSELTGPQTLQLLLERGADPNAESSEGERALDWAIYRSDRGKIGVLEKFGATRGQGPRRQPVAAPSDSISDPRVSVGRSVSLLLKSAPPMFQQRRCFTCHHNTVPAEAAALARRKGISIPEDLARRNLDDILSVLRSTAGPATQGRDNVPGGIVLSVGYGLMALAAESYPLDPVVAAHLHWTLATQMPDGSWLGNGASRPPVESSTMSHTAIAVRALTLYQIPGRKPEFDRALERARKWMLRAETTTAEDRAMRLMGLVWTKAPESAVKAAIQAIVQQQTTNGGWSQLSQLDPDAYATGLSLVALHEAGIRVNADAYRRGIAFLLSSQYPDGSWLVRSRAFPLQPYFESGFPFDRHQWISAAGTGWAAQAIARILPDGTPSALRR
jgi:ankyrin repeat protein